MRARDVWLILRFGLNEQTNQCGLTYLDKLKIFFKPRQESFLLWVSKDLFQENLERAKCFVFVLGVLR